MQIESDKKYSIEELPEIWMRLGQGDIIEFCYEDDKVRKYMILDRSGSEYIYLCSWQRWPEGSPRLPSKNAPFRLKGKKFLNQEGKQFSSRIFAGLQEVRVRKGVAVEPAKKLWSKMHERYTGKQTA